MKHNLFFCDCCLIEKYDSETLSFVDVPIACLTLAHWKQHIKTKKHSLNKAISQNLMEECRVDCKYCGESFSKKQYAMHEERNKLLWLMKTDVNNFKDCSCNNFIYNGKRFSDVKVLKSYTENRYDSGRKKQIYIPKPKQVKSFSDRGKAIQKYEDKKEKQRLKRKKKKKEEPKPKLIEEENIKIEISNVEESDEEDETPIEKARRERKDINIPPEIDPDDLCEECGYTRNEYLVYPIEKLERYNIPLCSCEETDSDEDI